MLRTDLQLKFVATLICVASRQILRHYDKLIIFPGKLNMCKQHFDFQEKGHWVTLIYENKIGSEFQHVI